MRRTIPLLLVAFLLALAGACASFEENPPTRHKTKREQVENVDTNALWQQTIWKGTLARAPSNAVATAIAELKTEKHHKDGTFLLRTDDMVLAARMLTLVQSEKGAAVVLEARLDPDGTTLRVTNLLLLPKDRKEEHR
jgi:hypothetical protein